MTTRRYRKHSNKRSLKKRGSRTRKNVRSSRRMRGGEIECKTQPSSWGNTSDCKYDFVVGKQYTDPTDTKIYTFIGSMSSTKDKKINYIYYFKDNQENDEIVKKIQVTEKNSDIITQIQNMTVADIYGNKSIYNNGKNVDNFGYVAKTPHVNKVLNQDIDKQFLDRLTLVDLSN